MNHSTFTQFLQQQMFKVVHYWFIRYNPLYFFSAFCVLLGIFLISNNLVTEVEANNLTYAHLLLTTTVQFYELLVIASIAFLARWINQYRPAVFLVLLELFFLSDCTFRIETLSGLDTAGTIFIVFWVLLAIFKLIAISWALQLQLPILAIVINTLAIIGIAILPFLFTLPNIDTIVMYLLANWYGVFLIILIDFFSPRIICRLTLDHWGKTVLRRTIRASWGIILGLYFYHLINRLIWFEQPFDFNEVKDIIFLLTQITPVIVFIGFSRKQEAETWITGIVAMICTLVYPPAIASNAFILAVVWGMQGWRIDKPSLYFGALLALYCSLWFLNFKGDGFPPLLPLISLENLILIAGLMILIWKWQLKAAMIFLSILVIGGFWMISGSIWSGIKFVFSFILTGILWLKYLFPQTGMGWGIFLLITGFIALIGGVIVNWSQRQTGVIENTINDEIDVPLSVGETTPNDSF
jgi:hypothetical protein